MNSHDLFKLQMERSSQVRDCSATCSSSKGFTYFGAIGITSEYFTRSRWKARVNCSASFVAGFSIIEVSFSFTKAAATPALIYQQHSNKTTQQTTFTGGLFQSNGGHRCSSSNYINVGAFTESSSAARR